MREFFTSLLDFLGLLALSAGAAFLVGHIGLGLILGGIIMLSGSALAARFTGTRGSDE